MRRINIIIVLIIMLIVITPNILKASEKKYNYNDSVKIANNYMYNLIKDNSYNRYLITNTNNRYYKWSNDDFSNGGLLSYKEFLITLNNNNPSTSYLYSGDDYWTYTKSNGDNNFVVSRTINYTKNKNKDKTNVKVTQYIKDDISVSGSGTIQDPWQFVPKYNIELDRTGGYGGPDRVSVFYLNHLPDISTPTKVGYSFDGYYTGLNGTGNQYYQSDGKSDIPWDKKSDSILYAKWKPNKVNIKFYVGADTNITSPTGSNYWKIGSDGYIYNSKDNKTFSKDFWSKSYSSNFDLPDYNNPGYIDIRLPNYGAVSGEEWCTKTNEEGTCYDQSTNYNIKDFCSNIEQSDCDITLYMNWQENKITYTYLANNYKCSNGSKVTDEYVFEYTGQCEVIDDGNDNWRLRFLTSGDFSCKKEFFVDMFLVGGGAQGGGYGGMVNELGNYKIYPNNTYKIIVGNSDEDTSIKSIESDKVILLAANGNKNNILEEGVCEFNENLENGKCKYSSENNYKDNGYKGIYATKGGSKYLGAGRSGTDKQKCEWDWYASTYCCCRQVCQGDQTPGAKNTGSGGARGTHYCSSTKGGSGIVIFRNAKPDIIVNGKVIGTYTGKFKVYESNSNWYVKFTTSGILSLNSSKQVDMFLVGGGAEYGGYGGYSSTKKNISLNANKDYYIEIGQSDQDTNFKDNNGTIIYSAARGTKTAGSNANGVCEFNEVNSDGTCKSKITNNFNGLYAAKGDSKLAGAGSKGTDTQRCEWDWGTSAYCCCRQVCDGNQVPAEKNSGSGGGGITHYCPGTKGGSGVIIIRNTR